MSRHPDPAPLRAKVYLGGDRLEYAYNRQSEIVRSEDGNGTVREYLRDTMGRLRHGSSVPPEFRLESQSRGILFMWK